MLSYLPSILNTWQLPGLAAGALSSALQRRILLYLLKRTLGHLIKDNEIKLDQIDVASFGGKLEVRGVHLDADAVTNMLPDGVVKLESGLVGNITIQLPWPNMSGDLIVSIADLDVCLLIDGSRRKSQTTSIAESISSLAGEVMHEDFEGLELEESIQASITDPVDNKDVPIPGFVANLVEGLLARLKVTIQNTCVRIRHNSSASSSELQLRVETINASTTMTSSSNIVQEVIRTATIKGVCLYLKEYMTEKSSSRDVSDDTEDSESETDYMAMSQAIPDLRSSQIGSPSFYSSASGQESVYASAIGGETGASRIFDIHSSSAKKTVEEHEVTEQCLLKIDAEQTLAQLVMTRQLPTNEEQDDDDEMQKIEMDSLSTAAVCLSLNIEVGNLVSFLTPASACALLRFTEDCVAILQLSRGQQEVVPIITARQSSLPPPYLETSITIKDIDVVCAYQSPYDLSGPQYEAFVQSLQNYWIRPSKVHPELGHLRLRLQKIQCKIKVIHLETSATVQLGDAAMYEHLSPSLMIGDERVAGTLPLMLFDHHLAERCAPKRSQDSEADQALRFNARAEAAGIETIDWRYAAIPTETNSNAHGRIGPYWKTTYGDRGWKVRPKPRHASSSATSVNDNTSVLIAKIDASSNVQLSLSPLHIFVDLSTVDRILPLLKSLGKSTRVDMEASMQSDLTASLDTLHQAFQQNYHTRNRSLLTLECDLIRLEVRVPSSTHQQNLQGRATRQRRLLGLDVRAGIIVVDARNVNMRIGSDESSRLKTKVHFNTLDGPSKLPSTWQSRQKERATCSVDQIDLYYKPVNEHLAINFAQLGVLSSDVENKLEKPLPPRLQFLEEEYQQGQLERPRSFVDCRLPVLSIIMSKPLLDGLELLADDFSLWSSSFGQRFDENNAESGTEALKILGSRFFGMRHSISVLSGSSASMEFASRSNATPALSLGVHEIQISLLVPSKEKKDGPARELCIRGSEFSLFVESRNEARSTLIDIAIQSLGIDDKTNNQRPLKILYRTLEPSLSRGMIPIVSAQLLSTSDAETSYRESKCEILLQGFTVAFHGDSTFVDDIILFTRSPDGAFEHVKPNEVTRLSLRLRDVSICVAPLSCEARAVIIIEDFALRTKLLPDAHQTIIRVTLKDSHLLVTEKQLDETLPSGALKARNTQEYWNHATYVKLIYLHEISASVTLNSLTPPEIDIKATKVSVEITACADTIQVVNTLSNHLIPEVETPTKRHSRSYSSSTEGEDTRDLLASLDQDAFRQAKPSTSIPDLLEDDIPRHPGYLNNGTKRSREENVPTTLEEELFLDGEEEDENEDEDELSNAISATSNNVILQNEVVTVRLLDENGIAPRSTYLSNAHLDSNAVPRQTGSSPSLRVRIHSCDLVLRLHAGYDCQTTRSAVEEEAKRVRKRLQKIKQMLDQGQTPDDSVEEATASLFDSIHIPLPKGQSTMEAGDMLQAMDEELGDQSETASSASTWKQFIPGRSAPILTHRQKNKRSKLMRSKKSLIDVEAKGIKIEYDSYSPKETLSSRILFQSKSVQILDNIKTSTWHTFLTEMAPEHTMLPRNAKDMVKIELVFIRPSVGAEVEVRCRARLSPIRLHVDQDALDFIKKFVAFRPPNALPDPPKSAKTEPFIQHAEIYPIKLKLDYKPKRVDYNLLREGKTMELMNFFSFEGSEMTLRHVTVRGISGWTKFFDTLQDIWTPDVKSNQLADVLSGIAPIRSLVNVGNGVADLILLPIEQYQRDGRIAKGLKAGAKSFVKSTMLEAAKIGSKLATGTQVILEQAEMALAGNVSSSSQVQRRRLYDDEEREGEGEEEESYEESDDEVVRRISRYANQPENLMQALSEAQEGLSRGFNEAAQTILAVPMEVYERRGGEGGSRPVVRAVPIAVLKGAAGASGAVGKTLQGIQRELAGTSLETEEDKYKKAVTTSSNNNGDKNSKTRTK